MDLTPHLRTRLAQAGCHPDPLTGALTPPLHLATTFERPASGDYGDGYVYARWGNPTRDLFETTLADLEADGLADGAEAAAFASGMAAVLVVFQSLRPGDHVLLPDDVYHGVRSLLRSTFTDWGLAYSEVDQADLDAVRAAVRPETKLVWAETPSNPLLKIVDIEALAGHRARRRGAAARGRDVDDAAAPTPAPPRRRSRAALGDEVPRRAF